MNLTNILVLKQRKSKNKKVRPQIIQTFANKSDKLSLRVHISKILLLLIKFSSMSRYYEHLQISNYNKVKIIHLRMQDGRSDWIYSGSTRKSPWQDGKISNVHLKVNKVKSWFRYFGYQLYACQVVIFSWPNLTWSHR